MSTKSSDTQQQVFILEGNIGAGKSTFLSLINTYLPVQIVLEPHTKWQKTGSGENLLDAFYKDTKRWAYTFQSYAFLTRILEQQEHSKTNTYGTQVLERSVYSDRYCRHSFTSSSFIGFSYDYFYRCKGVS